MSESPSAGILVARIVPCEQYRYRVELPDDLPQEVGDRIHRRTYEDTTDLFLESTRRFQSIAWMGAANLSFLDGRHSPSDSKSEFLHTLLSLKLIELALVHFRAEHQGGPIFFVEVLTKLRWAASREIHDYCRELGIHVRLSPGVDGKLLPLARMGGSYRTAWHPRNLFAKGPINRLEAVRSFASHRLSGHALIRRGVTGCLQALSLLFWPFAIVARMVFTLLYRARAKRLMAGLNSGRNAFVYFDLRMGRNRDVDQYLKWKFGSTFGENGIRPVVFSHFARPTNAYSRSGMVWALDALRKMKEAPARGCVVVNFLIGPLDLIQLYFKRMRAVGNVAKRLSALRDQQTDFIGRLIHTEFLSSLHHTRAFPLEIAAGYETFFRSFQPGVVVQADSIGKSARHFTACAKLHGCQVIYLADRICTELRTSNRLIRDEGTNPHLPDRFVVFDRVSQEEFLRQGISADRIYHYARNFGADGRISTDVPCASRKQVVVFLQAYGDNLGMMVGVGPRIVAAFPDLNVIYQEHPNFPVCDKAKARLLAKWPGRLSFLETGGKVDLTETLALITGYSTAVVPGVFAGVPLIWLRRPIDNSIYGETYMNPIGFAPADTCEEVIGHIRELRASGPATLEKLAAARDAARSIFEGFEGGSAASLPAAIGRAMDDCFSGMTSAR